MVGLHSCFLLSACYRFVECLAWHTALFRCRLAHPTRLDSACYRFVECLAWHTALFRCRLAHPTRLSTTHREKRCLSIQPAESCKMTELITFAELHGRLR